MIPMNYDIFKRAIDIAVASIGLLLLALPLSIVALLIKADSRGPVFFRQERVGRNGQLFSIYKFRTMIHGASNSGLGLRTARDDARITKLGALLRDFSVDEIPQLANVFLGHMSLIGPRPTVNSQVEQYNSHQRRRLEVRPGITSWAAVNGRNSVDWSARMDMDVWYVDHRSLWLDTRILIKTFWVAFVTRSGVYSDDGANDDFMGVQPADHGVGGE